MAEDRLISDGTIQRARVVPYYYIKQADMKNYIIASPSEVAIAKAQYDYMVRQSWVKWDREKVIEVFGSNHYGGDWEKIKQDKCSTVSRKDAQWIWDTADLLYSGLKEA